ncbi:hypothetical protein GA0070610_4853 [Micromonospora echinofusca]|uniref:Uncharacterized protein n=1 Tax=Micromonospora echinofusca TaxID=47858 RepID=A0A1C5GFF6_MICEH|nr:hypothetical protein [Micromonospora echinofusca]SCG18508.1 hypothetical protein GA0070610_4853 [Micromonospora echinofusca]
MNAVTGRRAAPDRDDRPSGPADGGGAGAPRGTLAPHPRVVPAAAPPEPPTEAAGTGSAPPPPAPAVEVEPTTGAPVDALPRRVPVRQPNRWPRRGRPVADGTPDPDDGGRTPDDAGGRSAPARNDAGRTPDGGDGPDDDGAYWPPIELVHWDGTPIREDPPHERRRSTRDEAARRRAPRRPRPPDPLPGLAALLALSLVTAFFAWVSAGPFWLAVGHATRGTVVIADCTGSGLTQRCRGNFAPADETWTAHGVRVSGVAAERTATGATLPARMTGPGGGTAYADTGPAAHLRWLLGLLVVLGCAAGIARWTGSTRIADPRARRWAVTGALAGPLVITAGFLVAAW